MPKKTITATTPAAQTHIQDHAVTCLQENLKRGLSIVSHAVAGKSTLPVLSNILLVSDGDRLRLQATNLEVGITCWIGAQTKSEMAVTVPSKLLGDFVGTLSNEAVYLNLDERSQTLNIRCDRSEANIKGIEAEEFPSVPSLDTNNPTFSINGKVLSEAIDQVAFAAATDETRPVLKGVLCRLSGKTVTLAATDGYRLCVKTIELSEAVQVNQEVIVPAKALIELGRVISDDDTVDVVINASHVVFHMETVEVVSRLIDGKYPDYQRIIPKTHDVCAVLDRGDFIQATKQGAVFAVSSSNIVKLTLVGPAIGSTAGRLAVAANASEVGDNKAELDDCKISGEGGQIALNVKFLQDALNAISTEQVVFEMQTSAAPGVFRQVGDDSLLIIVMPMSIK